MKLTVPAHGSRLVDRLVVGKEVDDLSRRARELPRLRLIDRQRSDVELIAVGALSPLGGFMGEPASPGRRDERR
jgi:sulfate adenylyltransferase